MNALRHADASTLFLRALHADARAADVALTVHRATTSAWSSATFAGHRHEVEVAVVGAAPGRWLAALANTDLAIRGHLLADLSVTTADDGRFRLLALTLVDG